MNKLQEQKLRRKIRQIIKEGAYDKHWISSLESEFDADVTVDKQKKIKDLYGGATYEMIGYLVVPREQTGVVQQFILEGLMINGSFVQASVIIQINGQWVIHSNLMIDVKAGTMRNDNISDVISKLKSKIESSTKR